MKWTALLAIELNPVTADKQDTCHRASSQRHGSIGRRWDRYTGVLMTDETTPKPPEADADWFAELSDSALGPAGPTPEKAEPLQDDAFEGAAYLPPLDRDRPPRTPLVPRWALIALISAVAAVVVIVAISLVVGSVRRVIVPDVVGATMTQASSTLAGAGLVGQVSERRFSPEPDGTVLEQDPAAGAELSKGDEVSLVVSAGTEDFSMPDVIGEPVSSASATLAEKGLVVSVETLVSDAPSDTVLASTPGPGSLVRTGDRVILQAAASTVRGVVLQPYSLTGVAVTVDAAPPTAGSPDVALEVARRVGALLEASGASVTMLRSTADSSTTEAERAKEAAEATSTLAIGFGLSAVSTAGRVVQSPSQGTAQAIASASLLSSAVTSELVGVAPPTSAVSSPSDPVLSASRSGWVRVLLGSPIAREDQALFADPNWADKVARAVYTAVGRTYGVVEQP